MPSPTLVIVPTSFCPTSFYSSQVSFLRSKGYEVHVLQLPTLLDSYVPDTPAPSMDDDAHFIRDFLVGLLDKGRDVVLLAHGYGGCPASQSLHGLTREKRNANGAKGGVVRLAFVSAVVPRLGKHVIGTVTASASGKPPEVQVDEYGWMKQTNPAETAKAVFNSLSAEAGRELSKEFGKHAAPAFTDVLTYAGYRVVSAPSQ